MTHERVSSNELNEDRKSKIFLKIKMIRARETVRLVKRLPYKHEGPSSSSSNQVES